MTRPALLLGLLLALAAPAPAQVYAPRSVEVHFSPGGGCTAAIVGELAQARRSIHVQAYSFTSAPIAAALRSAHQRGVAVLVLLDKSQRTEQYTGATFLANAGISVQIDAAHAIAHNKIIVIDGETVITGSFNFTKSAEERNAENLLVIRDRGLAARYLANWQEHARHSESYERAGGVGFGAPAKASARPARVTTPGAATGAAVVVYVTRSGSSFHRATCRYARGGTPIRLSEALARGLSPCRVCRPSAK